MSDTFETKHDRFLRRAERRLTRAREELRLVSQLSSRNYEYAPEEAREIVCILDELVRHIAQVFGVEYATRVGDAETQTTNGAPPISIFRRTSAMDEIEIVRVLELLDAGRLEEARSVLLTTSTSTEKRAAGCA